MVDEMEAVVVVGGELFGDVLLTHSLTRKE
jgi:hypothetical protein